jgi:hypothetical protein
MSKKLYHVTVCGSRIIVPLAVSAPYRGYLFEDKIAMIINDGHPVNFSKRDEKGELIGGLLFENSDFIKAGKSLEKMLMNAGAEHDTKGQCIVIKEVVGDNINPHIPVEGKDESKKKDNTDSGNNANPPIPVEGKDESKKKDNTDSGNNANPPIPGEGEDKEVNTQNKPIGENTGGKTTQESKNTQRKGNKQ